MAPHNVDVTLLPSGQIHKNIMSPLAVNPLDTVTWNFSGVPPGTLSVEFHTFMPRGGSPSSIGSGSNPFTSQLPASTGGSISGTISSTAAHGLYIYRILLNGQPLQWLNPLFTAGAFFGDFGGLEVPRT